MFQICDRRKTEKYKNKTNISGRQRGVIHTDDADKEHEPEGHGDSPAVQSMSTQWGLETVLEKKVVFRCSGAPCDVWWKYTFPSAQRLLSSKTRRRCSDWWGPRNSATCCKPTQDWEPYKLPCSESASFSSLTTFGHTVKVVVIETNPLNVLIETQL